MAMSMQYNQSVRDFFKSPKWGMNLLLGGVCMLIPLIGQILLSGWNITQLWARRRADDPPADQSMGDASAYPEFNFDNFVKYLSRGLWPFLVQLITGLAFAFVIMIVVIVATIFITGIAAIIPDFGLVLLVPLLLIGIVFYLALIIALNLVVVPLGLKATLTQSFNEAFDFTFAKNFIALIWMELIVASLFMFALGIALMILAILTLGLGMYFAMPPVVFAWQHLMKQLYLLHLERGGMAVVLSTKLDDLPPALPQTTQ